MAKLAALSCILFFLTYAGLCKGDWCIASSSAPSEKMQGFLNAVCGGMDCSPINPGGSCYEPNILASHCSFALNQNFRRTGVCAPDIGITTPIDPSHGTCHYS